jgi:Fe-S cluster biogenesis protein NfuA
MLPNLEALVAPVPASAAPRAGPRANGEEPSLEKKIQALIQEIEAFPNEEARQLLGECLQSVLALYGDGLERMIRLTQNAGANGQAVLDAFLHDKIVRGLLLIHGLHPQSLEARLQEALAKIRPYLQSHGGNVEMLRLENEVATLRLQGTCKTCPSSAITLELAVRQAIEEACPDLQGFEVEGVAAPDPANTLVCDEKILAK